MQISNYFYSKLLLYGEYTVTLGSGALALPFPTFAGSWVFNNPIDVDVEGLHRLAAFLTTDIDLSNRYDIKRFMDDIDNGLKFVSDIPTGYGLGSSGALVAAFYERYCNSPTTDMKELKSILGATESAFHGASSGLDPLVSYLNHGVLIDESGRIGEINLDINDDGYFLIDTGISRQTEYYVDIFREKLIKSDDFVNAVKILSEENKKAINACMSSDKNVLWQATNNISKLHIEHFKEMIPKQFVEIWDQGLQSGTYALKLCGAGGGGMILGLLPDSNAKIDFGPDIKTINI
jgi:mevalonate kinase